MMTIDEIRDNFALLDDWDDRYRYVIELGRTLDPMPESEHSAANKVQGCVSQVWLAKQLDRGTANEPLLNYRGDSDAHIVRGLIAILLTLYAGRTRHRVIRRNHGIVGRQAPFVPVLFRRHVVLRAQMALQRFEALAVLETY